MEKKKILKKIAIIVSLLVLLLDVYLYISMTTTWSEMGLGNYSDLVNCSLLLVGLFKYGLLIWGILLIPLIWIEYLLCNLVIYLYYKFEGLKKLFLCLIPTIAIVIVLIIFIIIFIGILYFL